MMKKILFIDRDGTLIIEPKDKQVDSFDKLVFYPKVITYLRKIYLELDYELVLVTNQDGLGTSSFPEETFWPTHDLMLKVFNGEGILFSGIHIDKSFPKENASTRKPRTGMLKKYINNSNYDLKKSFVIGDRDSDMILAKNIGSKGIYINLENGKHKYKSNAESSVVLKSNNWEDVYKYLKLKERIVVEKRTTNETDIKIEINLDGSGKSSINTGIKFFDHMLDQVARHGKIDLSINVNGDLSVDEHHTIEDTGIVLGYAFRNALKDKSGIERYGFCLPMDDCLAQVAIDFGGRSWLVWNAEFKREMIGKMPTEMFFHFFKSFSDSAKANINIKADGKNEHHKIESIFKAFAKAIRNAIRRDPNNMILPSTKEKL
jgi:imidazoleglycerol-phosphate dehydratase/histidinol-phosphatase